jgi:hypothetical protein
MVGTGPLVDEQRNYSMYKTAVVNSFFFTSSIRKPDTDCSSGDIITAVLVAQQFSGERSHQITYWCSYNSPSGR